MRSFMRETSPRRVLFGAGTVAQVGSEMSRLGWQRVLVITGGSAEAIGQRVAEMLGRRCSGVASEVRQHVPEELATRVIEKAKNVGGDGLCSVGGGSATGLAKAVALELDLPILAIPTTYAGSEMTSVWGITGEHKRTGRDPRVVPRVVIYDPDLVLSLSPRVIAASGLNALAHAIGVLLSRSDPISGLHAAEAVRILTRALPAAVAAPAQIEARSDALYGAYLAATALETGRLDGIHHRLCHILGGTHRLTHADVHAVLLPHTVAYESRRDPGPAAAVAALLETHDAVTWLHAFARRLGAPTSLAEIGMPVDDLDKAVGRAADSLDADEHALRRLLDDAHAGRTPRTNTEQKGAAT